MKGFALFCFAAAAIAVVVNAACSRTTINVKKAADLKDAMLTVKPGFDIVLAPGKYSVDESFLFGRTGDFDCPITLACAEYGTATLWGPFKLESVSNLNITNVTFKGTDYSDYCVTCNDCSNVFFDSVHVFNNKNVGMQIKMSSNITVHNSTFDNVGVNALLLSDTNNSAVEFCVFGDGITYVAIWFVSGSNNNVITSNSFYGNGYSKARPSWIIIDDNCANNDVSYNSFVNPNNHPMAGGVSCLLDANSNVFKENFMVLTKNAVGFLIQGTNQKVCASNKVFGGSFTNNDAFIDQTC